MSNRKRIIMAALLAASSAVVTCFLAWCGGFNFDHRGGGAFFTAITALGAAAISGMTFYDLYKR